MRLFRFTPAMCLAPLLLCGLPTFAAHALDKPADIERIESSDAAALAQKPVEELLDELKRERKPDSAKVISGAIQAAWGDSGSATANLLMQWAADAIKKKNNAAALDFLDQIIVLKPDYAEVWYRRATLHYAMDNYGKAVSDLNHALQLQPRHFAALSSLATILTDMGRDAKALQAWQDYLSIYPADRAAQEAVSTLSEKLSGTRT
ncbi:tetratricopeptide repeat protein [Allorhizobium undicola]|uniref:tetratricopeptide repeat protein n=1 Tax=Allorhizobium undicola TaxID=78527 RepID=UPI000B024A9B|nr:tetratricopeptide repeat protein [Allorhizobium undicola]